MVPCNAPYRGAALREFHEVAQLAGKAVRGQDRFERIYLLNAVEAGLQASRSSRRWQGAGRLAERPQDPSLSRSANHK